MKSVQTNAKARCPACLKTLNGATDAFGDASPKPGDVTLCAYCCQICIFHTDMTLRTIRPDELAALNDDVMSKVQRARAAILALDFLRGKDK